jgi:hypothetical protein
MDVTLAYDDCTTATPSLPAAWKLKVDACHPCRVRDQRSGIDVNDLI